MVCRDKIRIANEFSEHVRVGARDESHHRTISHPPIGVCPIFDNDEITLVLKEWLYRISDDDIQVEK
jgi:hypothetical protein